MLAAALLLAAPAARPLAAQTDYYNTDAGRPVAVEDAYAVDRHAFEVQLAPVRLERARGGVYRWGLEPELAYGILPRTHVEIGAPLAFLDAGVGRARAGLAGLALSALHNLNAETTSLPALAVSGGVLLPVGGLAPDASHAWVTGIATRTVRGARFHLNGQYTFGDASPTGAAELSRWLGGIAVDHAFPLRAMLLTAEVVARGGLERGAPVAWSAGGGVRYQVGTRLALDGGIGKRLTGGDRAWYATFGMSHAFAIRSLLGGR